MRGVPFRSLRYEHYLERGDTLQELFAFAFEMV